MKINYVSKQMVITDAIKSYVEKKAPRIQKFFEKDEVDFTITFAIHKNVQTVELLVQVKGLFLKCIETTSDIYASIDLGLDKMENQIARYKDRIHSRKYSVNSTGSLKMNVYDAESVETERPKMIVTKEIDAKPMSVDEAALQMELLNKTFFVYRNSKGVVNVIYKRDDGDIGLFEE